MTAETYEYRQKCQRNNDNEDLRIRFIMKEIDEKYENTIADVQIKRKKKIEYYKYMKYIVK